MERKHKVRRTRVNLQQKLNIIQQVENGKDRKVLARKYNLSHRTVSDIYNKRSFIVKVCKNFNEDTLSSTNHITNCIVKKIDMALLRYYQQSISCKKHVNDKILIEKLGIFASMLSFDNFKRKVQWVENFKKRYRLNLEMPPKYMLQKNMKFLLDHEIINVVGESIVQDDDNVKAEVNNLFKDDNDEKANVNNDLNWLAVLPNDIVVNNDDEVYLADNYKSECDNGDIDRDECSNSWMKNIKMTVNKYVETNEDSNLPLIEALKTVHSALNTFDIVPSEIYTAFNSVQDYITKQLSDN